MIGQHDPVRSMGYQVGLSYCWDKTFLYDSVTVVDMILKQATKKRIPKQPSKNVNTETALHEHGVPIASAGSGGCIV